MRVEGHVFRGWFGPQVFGVTSFHLSDVKNTEGLKEGRTRKKHSSVNRELTEESFIGYQVPEYLSRGRGVGGMCTGIYLNNFLA